MKKALVLDGHHAGNMEPCDAIGVLELPVFPNLQWQWNEDKPEGWDDPFKVERYHLRFIAVHGPQSAETRAFWHTKKDASTIEILDALINLATKEK